MDLITFRCSSCNRGLKVPAVNAGRKVKCTKCGTSLTVPATSQAAAGAPDNPFAKKAYEEDEDGGGVYDFEAKLEVAEEPRRKRLPEEDRDEEDDDVDPEEREEALEELRRRLAGEDEDADYEDEEDDERRPRKKKGPRAKLDSKAFQNARVGILLAVIAISFLAGFVLLHKIVLLIGLIAGPHYGESVMKVHPHYQEGADDSQSLDTMKLIVTLLGGVNAYSANNALLIIGQLFVLFQGIVMIAACAFCLGVPPRYGAKGLALTALVVAAVNLIVAMIFKFLPAIGVVKLVLVPLFGGELAMSNANVDRVTPLHIVWSGPAYVQVLLTLIVLTMSYGELIIFPLFLKAIALQLKSESLENSCNSLVQLGLAQVFMQLAYQLMAITGSTDVLSAVLKVIYILSLCFFVWQLVWYILILVKSRKIVQAALDKEERDRL